ncbi:MAG: ABC1 kinase family protein [Anaerolineales bacterium]
MSNFAVVRHIRHLRRYQHILNVFVRHGFGFALTQLPMQRKWVHLLRGGPSVEAQTLPSHFRQALEDLGPTFIKLGQVLSTRPDLLPPAYIAELSRLQDTVPPVAWEKIQSVIKEELDASPRTLFRHIAPQPMAAASLGQVHAAILPDGTEVVIKVQRPNIRKTIEMDLEILHDLAQYVERHTALGKVYELEGIAREFADTLHAEMNYRQEATNAERFRENFAGEHTLYIPRVYWEYTTQKVLVLERLEGIKIDNIGALEAAGYDRHQIAKHAAQLTVKEILEDGFFHADPHPGNFVVLEDEVIGAMDFGMVGYLSDEDRINLTRLYIVSVQMDAHGVVDELVHIGAAPADVDRSELAQEISSLLRRYEGLPLKEVSAARVMNEIRPIVFRHHLHLPSNYWLLGKTLAMMEGIGRKLDPGFDIFAFSKPYVRKLLFEIVLPNRRWLERTLRRSLLWGDLLDEVPRTGMLLLQRLQNRDPIPLTLEKSVLDRLDNLFSRLALSLLVTGITIGVALVIPATIDITWVRAVLYVSFGVALILGVWVLVSILRQS